MIKSKEITVHDMGGAADLICPRCGADNLHHEGVTVFDRSEDAPQLVRTSVAGGKTQVTVEDAETSANPSSRRDGIAITFTCEQCCDFAGSELYLTIAQHKGSTEIGWRYVARPEKRVPSRDHDPEWGRF